MTNNNKKRHPWKTPFNSPTEGFTPDSYATTDDLEMLPVRSDYDVITEITRQDYQTREEDYAAGSSYR